MPTIPEFDLVRSPVAGKCLIEASAGTGKTFTITGLFLRLLLERDLAIDKILVVTFTEAATNELKGRIRELLMQAKEDFPKQRSENEFLDQYIRKYPDADKAVERLGDAIRDFDEAAISTIHAFCNKVLQEHAFESGGLFDPELVTEQTELLREVVEDFWRKHLYGGSKLFISYAINKINPDSLFQLLAGKVGLAYLEIIPKAVHSDCSVQEARFGDSFQEIRTLWPSHKDEVSRILHEDRGLNRQRYNKASIPGWIRAMDTLTVSEEPSPFLFKGFDRFTSSTINNGTKQGFTPPSNPFFEVCETHFENQKELDNAYMERLISLKRDLFKYAREELNRRKLEKNINFFDDLLLNLHSALVEEGEELSSTVRSKYTAALIDEFQDTDPVQYEIFKKIFDHKDSILFLIGDPKQAIYGFRGADVFAYMRAKREVTMRYTLSKNYRSDPALISSINKMFEHTGRPFVYEEIPYHTASSPETAEREVLTVAGESDAPMRIWFVDASRHSESAKPLIRQTSHELITKAVAAEIARMLMLGGEKKALLGERPLEEKDIAVLVRTNDEARQMQHELMAVHVHSVLYSAANLFQSQEALEMERILTAVAEPKREKFLRAALATEIIGVNGEDLLGFTENESRLEAWFDRFTSYRRIWQDRGFMRMFKSMLGEEELLDRLMSFPDGERRITNLLHVAEALHECKKIYYQRS